MQAHNVLFAPSRIIANEYYFDPSRPIRASEFFSLMYGIEKKIYASYEKDYDSYLNDFLNSNIFIKESGKASDNLMEYISYKNAIHAMHVASKRIMGVDYVTEISPECNGALRISNFRKYVKTLKSKIKNELSAPYQRAVKDMYLTSSPMLISDSTDFSILMTRVTAASLIHDLIKYRVPCSEGKL